MKIEKWAIVPKTSPAIIRNCPGCRRKTAFHSSESFRINANGNKIDVWLIYRCEKCDSSWNLDIYTRISPGSLDKGLYERFQQNDRETALEYGCCKEILSRNRAEALWEQVEYDVEITELPLLQTHLSQTQYEKVQISPAEGSQEFNKERVLVTIYNQFGLPLRLDKLLCSHFGWSRKEASEMEEEGLLRILSGGKSCKAKIPECMEIEIYEIQNTF